MIVFIHEEDKELLIKLLVFIIINVFSQFENVKLICFSAIYDFLNVRMPFELTFLYDPFPPCPFILLYFLEDVDVDGSYPNDS